MLDLYLKALLSRGGVGLTTSSQHAGERRGNYLHFIVEKKDILLGIIIAMPLVTSPISCVQSRVDGRDLALNEH